MNVDGNLLASRFLTEESIDNLVELVARETGEKRRRATGWAVPGAEEDANRRNMRIAINRLLARAGKLSGGFETTYVYRGQIGGEPRQLDVGPVSGRPGKARNAAIRRGFSAEGRKVCLEV